MILTNKQVCDLLTILKEFIILDIPVTVECGYKIYYNIELLSNMYKEYLKELEEIKYPNEEELKKNLEILLNKDNPILLEPIFFDARDFGSLKIQMSQISILLPLVKFKNNM